MDFWDLTKLLFRRWYFAIPVLILTGVASIATLSNVHPNYIANAYVQLIPPTAQQPTKTGIPVTRMNPWIDLGLSTLANAAMVTLQDKSVLEDLDKAGLSDSFTVTLNNSSPLATFEVTGTSPAQASGTADAVVKRFEKSVGDLQSAYAVPDSDLISTRRLDLGSNLKESNSNVKRAVIAVAAVGVLFTVAWTIGVDALLFRRSRRRRGLADGDLPSYVEARGRKHSGRNEYRGASSRSQPGQLIVSQAIRPFDRVSNGVTQAVSVASPATTPPPDEKPVLAEESLTGDLAVPGTTDTNTDASADDVRAAANGAPAPDVTIVLPLSSQAARGRGADGEGKKRR